MQNSQLKIRICHSEQSEESNLIESTEQMFHFVQHDACCEVARTCFLRSRPGRLRGSHLRCEPAPGARSKTLIILGSPPATASKHYESPFLTGRPRAQGLQPWHLLFCFKGPGAACGARLRASAPGGCGPHNSSSHLHRKGLIVHSELCIVCSLSAAFKPAIATERLLRVTASVRREPWSMSARS